jgi:hypothetical protein
MRRSIAVVFGASCLWTACGGQTPPPASPDGGTPAVVAIGGTVTGLAGSGLVLSDSAGEDLRIAADGAFAFAAPMPSGAAFTVTVTGQPTSPSQTCTVSGGSGTVGAGAVTSVAVACGTNSYTVGGTVSGLAGSGLVLQNQHGDDLSVAANGAFAFATPVASGATFAVTIAASPASPSQTCTVDVPTGTVAGADLSLSVSCVTDAHAVSGLVSGLLGVGLVLQNSGGDDLTIADNGAFTFATSVASGAAYAVTVETQPAGQTCTVSDGNGTVAGANVGGVMVVCEVLVNGSFESADYTGWTLLADQEIGTCGTWGIAANGQTVARNQAVFDFFTGHSISQSSSGLPATFSATDGTELAVAFQNCGERHRMYQTVTIPAAASTLAWDMSYDNTGGSFDAGDQYIAVNLRDPTTDAVLVTLYKTTQGEDAQELPAMTTFSKSIAAYAGQTVRIDVEMQVRLSFLDGAFDNFRLQ